jgi:hypothetical protein
VGCAGRTGWKGGKWAEAMTGVGRVLKRNEEEKQKGSLAGFKKK